jgi:hypothetical protein
MLYFFALVWLVQLIIYWYLTQLTNWEANIILGIVILFRILWTVVFFRIYSKTSKQKYLSLALLTMIPFECILLFLDLRDIFQYMP